MPFRFALEAVLHFRKSVEHQQELRLRAANQHFLRARRLMELTERKIREMEERRVQQLRAGMTGAELQFLLVLESGMRGQIPELQREITRLQTLRDEQQRIYQQARREREILESLRQRKLREHEREAARRQQRQLDDLFLLRQAYLRQASRRQDSPEQP